MIGMAPNALFSIRILHLEARMISVVRLQPLRDLFVTIEALKRWDARPELMAGYALRRARQGVVSPRQWTGGNLSQGRRRENRSGKQKK
jgi:hypothetical protein